MKPIKRSIITIQVALDSALFLLLLKDLCLFLFPHLLRLKVFFFLSQRKESRVDISTVVLSRILARKNIRFKVFDMNLNIA